MTRRWTGVELEDLRDRYHREGSRPIAARWRRSVDSVSSRARRLGLKAEGGPRRRAETRSAGNRSCSTAIFEAGGKELAYLLGVVFARGRVKLAPRKTLRLRFPESRPDVVRKVQALLQLKHSTQVARDGVLIEVPNHHLVDCILDQYGRPGDPADSARLTRALGTDEIPHFVQGMIDATPQTRNDEVIIRGHETFMTALRDAIVRNEKIAPPQEFHRGDRVKLSWTTSPISFLSNGDIQAVSGTNP